MVSHRKPEIAVVLNAFKRTNYLKLQLDAIENQTIKPAKIYVWQNKGGKIPSSLKAKFILAECSDNLGVWARFAFALNIDSDYICIFDDDTVPGQRWFENCLETIEKTGGLLGTRGLRYISPKSYYPFDYYGWDNPNEKIMQVDIVGHAWFFRREHLAMFWSEMPPQNASKIAGEDIHFSYMLQKYGIGTYVPPHPRGDTSMWGSLPEYGKTIGTDFNAISRDDAALSRFDIALRYYTSKGFRLYLRWDQRLRRGIALGTGVPMSKAARDFWNRWPRLKALVKWLIGRLGDR